MLNLIVNRVKGIMLTPKDELLNTVGEPGDVGSLLLPYVLPMVAIGAAARLLASGLAGGYGGSIGVVAVVGAVVRVALGVGGWWLLAILYGALASSFDGQKDVEGANKAAAYTLTPVWVAGALGLLEVLPGIGAALYTLGMIAALVYSIFVGIWAVPLLLGTPENKAVGHVLSAMAIGVVAFGLATFFVFGLVVAFILNSFASRVVP